MIYFHPFEMMYDRNLISTITNLYITCKHSPSSSCDYVLNIARGHYSSMNLISICLLVGRSLHGKYKYFSELFHCFRLKLWSPKNTEFVEGRYMYKLTILKL